MVRLPSFQTAHPWLGIQNGSRIVLIFPKTETTYTCNDIGVTRELGDEITKNRKTEEAVDGGKLKL
jgi:hypothetical protein